MKKNPLVAQYLSTAENASQKAYELARQLHSYSNEGPHRLKLTDISRIIKESASFTYHGSNIIDDNRMPDNLWPVYIDEQQFLSVFNNLFINAAQAMPQGGTVTINAKNVVLDNKNGMQLKPGKYVHVTIKDNGIGIPRAHFKKIFDPFFTTKQKGSGLGLSTCFSVIIKHKGYITVESELGAGTVFHIYLHASDEKLPIQDEVIKEGFFIIGRKILLLDDQEDIRELSYNMLKEIGCEVHLAQNGYEVVEMYQDALNHEKPFDIVILDLVIPGGMGGEETFRVLQAMDPNVNAVISSGCTHDPVLVDYQHYGFSGVIQKPYNLQKLSMVLYNVLRRKSLEQYDFVNLSNGFVSDFKNSKIV
jgi:CheY-like chemotaxis protein